MNKFSCHSLVGVKRDIGNFSFDLWTLRAQLPSLTDRVFGLAGALAVVPTVLVSPIN